MKNQPIADMDQFHQKLAGHLAAEQFDVVDQMINQCELDNGECGICSVLCCPHGEPFHFHHDGCPACCQDDEPSAGQFDIGHGEKS